MVRLRTLLAIALAFVMFGCGDDLAGGPSVTDMTITPSTIAVSDTGMTDEFFSVQIQVAGFSEPVDAASTRVFFSDGATDIEGIYGSSSLVGTTIQLDRIATSWFQGQTPGSYELGVTVQSVADDSGRPAESVTEFGLASVTITE